MNLQEFDRVVAPLPETCPICGEGEVVAEPDGEPHPFIECDHMECRFGAEGYTLEEAVDNFLVDAAIELGQ